MGGFRRFVLFVFSLAGIACLAALALPWLGLFPDEIAELESYGAYVVAVEVCLAMTAAWFVFELLRALLSRRPGAIEVMDIDGGTITVTRSAVASQASHIVEALGLGTAKDVDVRASKGGPVHVVVRVTPHESIDVTAEAPVLHEALVTGLTAMCGERLGAVDVEFLEPEQASSLVVPTDESDGEEGFSSEEGDEPSGDEPAPGDEAAVHGRQGSGDEGAGRGTHTPDDTGDITIRMTSERGE